MFSKSGAADKPPLTSKAHVRQEVRRMYARPAFGSSTCFSFAATTSENSPNIFDNLKKKGTFSFVIAKSAKPKILFFLFFCLLARAVDRFLTKNNE